MYNMKILWFHICTIFVLHATGDPAVNIKLTPIAVNEHKHILFATQSSINHIGSYSCSQNKYGWLVVHANGLWMNKKLLLLRMTSVWI